MKLPPYVHAFKDRHGKLRAYYRRPGYPSASLPGIPWTPEFMTAYQAASKKERLPPKIGAARTKAGSINALAVAYYESAEFQTLARSTQNTYRGIIERFRAQHGERSIAGLDRQKVAEMLARKVSTPAAANNWLRIVRLLMRFAIERGLRQSDPTQGVRTLKIRSPGFATWQPQHIAAYRAHHAMGTKARLAMELLFGTIQRRSDIVRLGPQHFQNGVLSFRQQKTRVLVEIPIISELRATLEASDTGDLCFLTTDYGKGFSAAGFGNKFREWCDQAGLPPELSSHGLRKAGATRLAESGCTDHEIMAWGGWKTLKEVTRYTAAANQRRLAQSAAEKLEARTSRGKPDA